MPTSSTTSCRSRNAASSPRRTSIERHTRTGPARWRDRFAGRRGPSTTTYCWRKHCKRSTPSTRGCSERTDCSITSFCRTARTGCAACSPITSRTRARCSTRTRCRASRAFSHGHAPSSKPFSQTSRRKRAASTTGSRATKTSAASRVADRPIVDNGLFAETLLRMAAFFGESAYRERAKEILRRYRRTAAASGPFAATYARALRRFLTPELTVKIVGEPAQTDDFREAAVRLPGPVSAVRTLPPQDASDAQLPAEPQPAAYVCTDSACGAPVRSAADLRAALDAHKVQPVPAAPQAGSDRIND